MISEDLRKALTEVRPLPIRYTVDDLEFMPDFSLKVADIFKF